MKKLDAKSWIIIGASALVMGGIVGLTYYNFKKAESDAQTMASHEYAQQSTAVTEPLATTSSIYSDEMIEQYLSTFDNSEPDPYLDQEDGDGSIRFDGRGSTEDFDGTMYFNIVEDANYASPYIDIDTISIDGQLIDLPCDYQYLVDKFGELHSSDFEDYGATDTVNGEITVGFDATTGAGRVDFTFTSDGESKPLSECRCIGISIISFNFDADAQNMTVSLPGNTHFGDTFDETKYKFPVLFTESDAVDSDWSLTFIDSGFTYVYFGQEHQMNMVLISWD